MQSDVNWRAPARLWRRPGFVAHTSVEVGGGDLAEMVTLAMKQPADQRHLLFVSCDANGREIAWHQLSKLASRADFPFFI